MEHINELFKEVLNESKKINLPISNNIINNITLNKRAKSRFGCCKKIKKGMSLNYEIELSNRLIGCDDKIIKQILAHEILHTCQGCNNHGSIWKSYAEKMNIEYGYNIKRTETAEELGIIEERGKIQKPLEENYVIICKKCGARISRTRKSNVVKCPAKYRCKCGGKLERIK